MILAQGESMICEGIGMGKVLDEIRRAIQQGGESRYSISKATGISEAQLSRLMAGQAGLSINRLELLADHLGLEIIIRPKRRRKASK